MRGQASFIDRFDVTLNVEDQAAVAVDRATLRPIVPHCECLFLVIVIDGDGAINWDEGRGERSISKSEHFTLHDVVAIRICHVGVGELLIVWSPLGKEFLTQSRLFRWDG